MHHLTNAQFEDVRTKIIRYCDEMYRPYLDNWLLEGYEAMLLLLAETPLAPEDMPPMPKAFFAILEPKGRKRYEVTKAMMDCYKEAVATLRTTKTPKEFISVLAATEAKLEALSKEFC